MHFSSGCRIMWKYTKVINITIVKMMKKPWAYFSAGPVTVSKQILQLLFLLHCLCLSNNINSYKISAVHLDAAFNNWLWRQVYMMSLNQVYMLIAFFSCPCVFPDGQSSSCRKGSPQRLLIQTRQRHRRGDREAAPSPGRGIEAFLSLTFTLGNLCDVVTDWYRLFCIHFFFNAMPQV